MAAGIASAYVMRDRLRQRQWRDVARRPLNKSSRGINSRKEKARHARVIRECDPSVKAGVELCLRNLRPSGKGVELASSQHFTCEAAYAGALSVPPTTSSINYINYKFIEEVVVTTTAHARLLPPLSSPTLRPFLASRNPILYGEARTTGGATAA